MLLAFDTQTNFVSPLVSGILHGSAYGLLGLGLVLIYKSNRIFNFAQGEFATLGAMVAFWFVTGQKIFGVPFPHLPYGLAVLLGIAAAVLVALATERVVIRPMFDRPRVVLVVGTVGVALFLIAVEGLAFPHQVQLPSIDQALHLSPNLGHIDGVPVAWSDFIQLVVLVVLAVLAFLFFRYTPTGTAILAVSQDPTAARVVGIRVERISMITWGLAGLLGGITGILLAVPPLGAVPGQFTGFTLTAAFAAAVVGGMTSLPGAFVGGLAVGLVKEFANSDALLIPGIQNLKAPDEVTVALFILLVLLLRPRGLLGKEA